MKKCKDEKVRGRGKGKEEEMKAKKATRMERRKGEIRKKDRK
jgi:hypothetical protein